MRKTIPFLKRDYFTDSTERRIFDYAKEFIDKYNNTPNIDALIVKSQNDKSLGDEEYKELAETIQQLVPSEHNKEWLITETEKFCKDKAVYNAILASIAIIDGRDKAQSQDGIPQILQDALGVCFDNNVGHDYIDNSESRFDFYHKVESRIPFDLEMFNKVTNGGLPNKTLNVVLAGTGVGKSLFMCHVAASTLSQGKNVLYITMEMAEERIAERIDANLMNVTMDQLKELPKAIFDNKIEKIRNKTEGKLIIKEYPTAGAHVGHFNSLLNELQLKKQFNPDIIIVDYLNICASSRFKAGANINSYTLIKAIAEELRGMAVENNVPILSATQTTRGGYGNTDVELTDTSECLDPTSQVITESGDTMEIQNLKPGDRILGSNGFVSVIQVHHSKIKKLYKIKTRSGKNIICSADHIFPTSEGRKNINNGLRVGCKIRSL